MKIALKYGLPITAIVILWVLGTRYLFPIGANSRVNLIAPVIFNLAAIVAIYLGISARNRETGGKLKFKDGVNTGVGISAVYGASASLFFLILFLIVGPELMTSEPLTQTRPLWQTALLAYAGLFFGALFFGLIYSALISFILVRLKPVSPSLRSQNRKA
jgi:hypothetical protein